MCLQMAQFHSFFLGQSCSPGLPWWLSSKELTCQCRRCWINTWVDLWGQEDPLGEGNGSPFQYSCLGNPVDRGAWQVTVHGVAKSGTQLSTHTNNNNVYASVCVCVCVYAVMVVTIIEIILNR